MKKVLINSGDIAQILDIYYDLIYLNGRYYIFRQRNKYNAETEKKEITEFMALELMQLNLYDAYRKMSVWFY